MKSFSHESFARAVFKNALPVFLLVGLVSSPLLRADDNPYDGYTDTDSYFLKYADDTSFSPTNDSDVEIDAYINGTKDLFNVDTGSRGVYASSTELGPGFGDGVTGTYAGQIQLDSSGRISSGIWTPTSIGFDVTDKDGNTVRVTSSVNVLDVTTLSAQSGRTAQFGVNPFAGGVSTPATTVTLDGVGAGTVPIQFDPATSTYYVLLSNTGGVNQQISYANNTPGLINDVSNFGIGFDLSGEAGGTGPVGNNENQIYNPLINLDKMKDGTLVAGFVIKSTGIQLGLTDKDKGYAYTSLNPTGFTSTNSVPDWQTPMGQTTVHGITNGPGSIVMDSGVSDAFISAPGLTVGDSIESPIPVSLMNSGTFAGYTIDLSDTSNYLNPSTLTIVAPNTDGIYSQNQPPYQADFFNTGRNVFDDFDMLYDAQNGYMGVIPNSYGETDPNVFFTAQPGGFPDPIPEGSSIVMMLIGLALIVGTMKGKSHSGKRPVRIVE